jgi:hypothetical protein
MNNANKETEGVNLGVNSKNILPSSGCWQGKVQLSIEATWTTQGRIDGIRSE